MTKHIIIKDGTVKRARLSREAKDVLLKQCESPDVHVELNITYRQVAERVFGWLSRQEISVWNEVIKILDKELIESKDKCFSGKLSRLVSCLDGFHPGVRISITTSEQISNRILLVLNNGRENKLEPEEILVNALRELRELELNEVQVNEWLDLVRENLEDID
jgi:hypothetical protein